MKPKFWMIWSPTGAKPTKRHESLTSARTEAERLARANNGRAFIVLESVGEVQKVDVTWDDHSTREEMLYRDDGGYA